MSSEPRPSQAAPQPIPVTALDIAARYLGTSERLGRDHNPHVVAWLYDCGLVDVADETPWCGSFVAHVARLLSLPRPKSPASARAWLTVGTRVELDAAVPGFDLVVLSRGVQPQPGPEVIAAAGHVGWYYGRHADGRVLVLGGNQADSVTVSRYDAARVLGVRRLRS